MGPRTVPRRRLEPAVQTTPRDPAPRESASGPATAELGAMVHVARQPILDVKGQVFGYELLYRATQTDTSCTAEGDLASARVLTDAVLEVGLDTLTGGRPAFLNLTKPLITSKVATLLPKTAAVFELREDVEVDDTVIEACRDLHARGYRLALDDFVAGSAAEQLLPYVSFVKIDVQLTDMPLVLELPRRYKSQRVTMVAEKVETREVFEATKKAGYTLFQGYYFRRPVIQTGKAMPANHATYMRLLAELNREDLTILELEALIKQDAALSLGPESFPATPAGSWTEVELYTSDQRLFARPSKGDGGLRATLRGPDETRTAVLSEPVAFFIPEHVEDPSRRAQGEELWVEVTLPRAGAPRPIRLGIRRNGELTPLALR